MIVRVFQAKALPGKAAELEQEIEHGSTALVEAQQGVVTYFAGRPIGSASDEFVMITVWEDLAAVKAFAGETHAISAMFGYIIQTDLM